MPAKGIMAGLSEMAHPAKLFPKMDNSIKVDLLRDILMTTLGLMAGPSGTKAWMSPRGKMFEVAGDHRDAVGGEAKALEMLKRGWARINMTKTGAGVEIKGTEPSPAIMDFIKGLVKGGQKVFLDMPDNVQKFSVYGN